MLLKDALRQALLNNPQRKRKAYRKEGGVFVVKITRAGSQYRINIPWEIMGMLGWDENTELSVFPYPANINAPLTPDTPVIIKRISSSQIGEGGKG
jgi:hypothetical protein